MVSPVGILPVPSSDSQLAQWRRALATPRFRLLDPAAVESASACDILLVAANWTPASAAGLLAERICGGQVGIIAWDAADCPAADICLPASAPDRELRNVCRLLGELVRLRREHHQTAQARAALEDLAATDHLTGLPNRRAWDTAIKHPGPAVLVMLDLDHFKAVNDAGGHAAGDEVLKQVARRLRASIRHGDLAARLGGDEFGVLLSASAVPSSYKIVDRIRQSITCAVADGMEVTASAGFAVLPAGERPDQLLNSADAALRAAKLQGRNRTVAAV